MMAGSLFFVVKGNRFGRDILGPLSEALLLLYGE
jgi:hypothetical protein